MTTAPSRPATSGPADALTPTLRQRMSRGRTWIVLAVVLLAGAAVLFVLQGGGSGPGEPLAADNAGPAGAQAVVRVLEANGVEVVTAATFEAAIDAADDADTLFVFDSGGFLDRDRIDELASTGARLVVAEPDFAALEQLAPGVRLAGVSDGALDDASCSVGAARSAEALSDEQRLLRIDEDAETDGWTGCFPDGEDGVAVAVGETPSGAPIALVGGRTVFENGSITESGNAALALGLLGADDRLVWYLPGALDVDAGDAPTLAELTPGWVSPVAVLLLIATIVAGVWRGRRFGALVVEDLPVHVRAGETSSGRARLYERSAARSRAIDQLRIGAFRRLARMLRLPRAADVGVVSAAVASVLGHDAASVHRLLVDQVPQGDADLVELARRIRTLEDEVRRAVRPPGIAAVAEPTEDSERYDQTDSDPLAGRRP